MCIRDRLVGCNNISEVKWQDKHHLLAVEWDSVFEVTDEQIEPVSYTHLKVNSFGEMMIATRHGNTTVKKGDKLAGLGEGGLCLNCDVGTFPNCGFGKGF